MQNQQQPASVQHNWTPAFKLQPDNHAAHVELASMPAEWTARVPVAATTVLALDLLLQESSLDLSAAANIILSDVGATLQVLRLAASCQLFDGESAFRIEDCLAQLEPEALFGAVAARTLSRSNNATQLNAVWQHSRLVAQYAEVVAESLEVAPGSAYLVGLLHEIETVFLLLDEQGVDASSEESLLLHDIVPPSVLAALASAKERGSNSMWRYILSSAHSLASAMPQFVPSSVRSAN